MGRIRDRTQLLGTGRWRTRSRTYHGFSSETPQSPSTYQIRGLRCHSFSNTIISSAGTSLPWRGGGCKGTLILAFFTDGISPPHDSGHIPSMQHPVHPTTSSVKQPTPCPSLPWWFVRLRNRNSETYSEYLNLIPLFAIVVAITNVVLSPLSSPPLFLAVYNVGLILAEAPSYSLWTSC